MIIKCTIAPLALSLAIGIAGLLAPGQASAQDCSHYRTGTDQFHACMDRKVNAIRGAVRREDKEWETGCGPRCRGAQRQEKRLTNPRTFESNQD